MKVSANAGRVLKVAKDNPTGQYTIEELAHEVRLSRTAVARALRELEEAGAVTIEEETT